MPWTRSSSSKDLRKYLEKATLPIMIQSEHAPDLPADGHKSHMNALVVRPETYRQLECIRHVKDVWMGKEVAKCQFPLDHCMSHDCSLHSQS
jgi:hypothetical protein